jgi:predicted lipoprotein with Yx(FWY)xxD motif
MLAAAAVSGGTVVSTAHNAQLKNDIIVAASGMTLYE